MRAGVRACGGGGGVSLHAHPGAYVSCASARLSAVRLRRGAGARRVLSELDLGVLADCPNLLDSARAKLATRMVRRARRMSQWGLGRRCQL